MNKKEEFKIFAKSHPELVTYIKNGTNTWQDFYEIYDIYGDSNEAWKDYFTKTEQKSKDETPSNTETKNASNSALSSITNIFKKADVKSIQKHIGTAQKALGFFQELTTKEGASKAGALAGLAAKGPKIPRPLNKFFED